MAPGYQDRAESRRELHPRPALTENPLKAQYEQERADLIGDLRVQQERQAQKAMPPPKPRGPLQAQGAQKAGLGYTSGQGVP